MSKFIFLFIFFPLILANADEPKFHLSFGSNFKNMPIQIDRTNEKMKKPFSINLNKWLVSPGLSSLVLDSNMIDSFKKNTTKDKLFFKFKLIF